MNKSLSLLAALLLPFVLFACSDSTLDAETAIAPRATIATLDVYKSATCGCCDAWITHMEEAGFEALTHNSDDLNQVKVEYGIAARYQSCHTAVSQDGYIFEGHVPAPYVQAFLENPPADAIGLAVPGMPMGSPGMQIGENFTPYQIWLLKEDGRSEIFVSVENSEQQYRADGI